MSHMAIEERERERERESALYLTNDAPILYNLRYPLSRDVLFCFLSEVPVTNRAAQ